MSVTGGPAPSSSGIAEPARYPAPAPPPHDHEKQRRRCTLPVPICVVTTCVVQRRGVIVSSSAPCLPPAAVGGEVVELTARFRSRPGRFRAAPQDCALAPKRTKKRFDLVLRVLQRPARRSAPGSVPLVWADWSSRDHDPLIPKVTDRDRRPARKLHRRGPAYRKTIIPGPWSPRFTSATSRRSMKISTTRSGIGPGTKVASHTSPR